MNASELNLSLRFLGGMPMLILRDHNKGRIKVFCKGVWVATVIPGEVMLCPEYEAFLLSKDLEDDVEYEWRGTYVDIAAALSVLQQTGSWDEADLAFDEARDISELLFG